MDKINIIQSRKDAQMSFQLNDGRFIEIVNKDGQCTLRYDTPFNLETGEIPMLYSRSRQHATCPEGYTTLENLSREGKGKTVNCYDQYDIDLGYIRELTERRIDSIIKEFKNHGFNVTETALLHNFGAWRGDYKSGYRDECNGYHLFTPCGCNPLSFRASTLEECCSDWQTTYMC